MKSPLTTIFGAIAAAGLAVTGAEATGMINAADMPHWLNLTAVLCMVIGAGLAHFFARDNGTSDEAAGAKPDWTRPPNGFAVHEILILTAIAGLLVLLLLSGCAIGGGAYAKRDIFETNGVHTIERAKTHPFIAFGDAVNHMGKERISNTKTGNSIGISGFDQETSTTNVPAILDSAGGLIGSAARTFMGLPAPKN